MRPVPSRSETQSGRTSVQGPSQIQRGHETSSQPLKTPPGTPGGRRPLRACVGEAGGSKRRFRLDLVQISQFFGSYDPLNTIFIDLYAQDPLCTLTYRLLSPKSQIFAPLPSENAVSGSAALPSGGDLGIILGPSPAILGRLGADLGASWAILGSPWAILGLNSTV